MRITWRSSVVLAAALAASACGSDATIVQAPKTADEVPVRPFDSLFVPVSEVRLRPDSLNPIGYAVSMAVGGSRVFIADPAQHDVKLFDRATGALIKSLGRQGSGPGEFQTPATLALVNNGDRLAVFDINRNILSVWDTLGRLGYENQNTQFLISFVPIPGTTRVLTGGYAELKAGGQFDSSGRRPQVHEVDYTTGEMKDSYIMQPMSVGTHAWAGTYSTPRATLVGDVAVAGAMASRTLWLRNRTTGREWETTLLAPWYQPPSYPKEYSEPGKAEPGEMEAMEAWSRKQYLLGYLIPLKNGRFLAQFVTRDKDEGRFYNYIIADTAGNSWLSTEKTTVRLMQVQDTLAFGINPDADDGETSLLTFRIAPSVFTPRP